VNFKTNLRAILYFAFVTVVLVQPDAPRTVHGNEEHLIGEVCTGDLQQGASPDCQGQVSNLEYVVNTTEKLEQLIGDWDKHLQKKTRNRTFSRYGIVGTDLGYSFEHHGRLLFLFGDTIGPGGGDCIAHSATTDPEQGLTLEFIQDADGRYLKVRPRGISMKGFEVPAGGISLDDRIYLFCTTDHTDRETMGRSVLVRFDETSRSFQRIRDISTRPGKFINVAARLAPHGTVDLPRDGIPHVLMWGSGAYRKSNVYLACTPARDIEHKDRTFYFSGLKGGGKPQWSMEEAAAVPIVKHPVVGELSVVWCESLRIWLMTYNSRTPRGIVLRWSPAPWGPWSEGTVIFNGWRDGGYTVFMHAVQEGQSKGPAGPIIVPDSDPKKTWGGEYGPYMIERFLEVTEDILSVYYVMSTWNPYTVILMKSKLRVVR
jgi:hypothetical protein